MLDNLRESASQSPFFSEEEEAPVEEQKIVRVRRVPPSSYFLGMTPAQRFTIVLILFMMTCLLGSFCLIISDKIALF